MSAKHFPRGLHSYTLHGDVVCLRLKSTTNHLMCLSLLSYLVSAMSPLK